MDDFVFSPLTRSFWDKDHEYQITYYDIDDMKSDFGWTDISNREDYFETLLAKYNNQKGYWSIYNWWYRANDGHRVDHRFFNKDNVIRFIEEYIAQMPKELKENETYNARNQSALEWIDTINHDDMEE